MVDQIGCSDRQKNQPTVCPNCGNRISDPAAWRCIRCLTLLFPPECSGNCRKCGQNSAERQGG